MVRYHMKIMLVLVFVFKTNIGTVFSNILYTFKLQNFSIKYNCYVVSFHFVVLLLPNSGIIILFCLQLLFYHIFSHFSNLAIWNSNCLLEGPPITSRLFTQFIKSCLLYTSPSPRDGLLSRMPSSA